jgi:nucleoside-diphosphate-sugar epimerase
MNTAAITGASGYVGSAIARCFRAQGWHPIELGRRSSHPYDLSADVKIDWTNINALVHCAWDFRLTHWQDVQRINVRGSIRLMESARQAGVPRGVFISSLSCFEGCRSLYGKGKLLVEKEALRLGFAVVRPGLVYGDHPGGMMGSLEKAATAAPRLPLIGNGTHPQYPVHEEDLAALVLALCQRDPPPAPLSAASGQPIPFRDLLLRLAARHGRKPLLIPIPWPLILAALKSLEALGLNPPFRSDSLTGFIFQNPAPDFSRAHHITSFRPF